MKKISPILEEFKIIFLNLKSLALVSGLTLLFLIFLVTISNFQSIKLSTFIGGNNLLFNFLNSVYFHLSGFRIFSLITTILVAILFGFNIVAIKNIGLKGVINRKASGTTISGLAFSLLGAGCSACGVLAVSFFSIFGMGALVSILPFNGVEFDLLGIVLLIVSLILILKQSITKNNCKISHE